MKILQKLKIYTKLLSLILVFDVLKNETSLKFSAYFNLISYKLFGIIS